MDFGELLSKIIPLNEYVEWILYKLYPPNEYILLIYFQKYIL
jgi:hypothetical protein